MKFANTYKYLPRLTIMGCFFLSGSTSIILIAIAEANIYFLLIGCFLVSLWLVCGIINSNILKSIGIRRAVPSDIFANDDIEIKFTVINNKNILPAVGLEGQEFFPEELRTNVIGSKPANITTALPGSRGSGIFWCKFMRRGRINLQNIMLQSSFPAGFFISRRILPHETSFEVFPRLGRIKPNFNEYLVNLAAYAGTKTQSGQGEEEYKSLREYQTGDSLRHIHWRSSAKMERLLVREYEPPQIESVYVFLDSLVPPNDRRRQIRFEKAISVATSLMYHLALMEKKIWFGALKKELDWVGPFALGSSMYQLFRHMALLQADSRQYDNEELSLLCTKFIAKGLVIIISLEESGLAGDKETARLLSEQRNFLYITPSRYNEFVELTEKVQDEKTAY